MRKYVPSTKKSEFLHHYEFLRVYSIVSPFFSTGTIDDGNDENGSETEEEFLLQVADNTKKYVYVNTRIDYQHRSASLDDICLYDYISFYRKKDCRQK